jgi:hypothetical protein
MIGNLLETKDFYFLFFLCFQEGVPYIHIMKDIREFFGTPY